MPPRSCAVDHIGRVGKRVLQVVTRPIPSLQVLLATSGLLVVAHGCAEARTVKDLQFICCGSPSPFRNRKSAVQSRWRRTAVLWVPPF